MSRVAIYTDGSAAKDRSGWGVIWTYDDNIITYDAGTVEGATNQQMELLAAIKGCERITDALSHDFDIWIYSDSAYLINCYNDKWYLNWQNNGWLNSKKEPVANQELWEQLIPYFENPSFHFEKVKGHGNNYFNNVADKLATTGKMPSLDK